MITSRILPPAVLGQRQASVRPALPGSLGTVSRCPSQPTLCIFLCDSSGSVTAPGGADPISNRFSEIELALRAVAKACRCKRELAAVVHFDTPAGDAGPVPLTKSCLAQLLPALRIPDGGFGTSDLMPSLQRAADIAAAHPEHEAVVVILSDFLLTDVDPGAVTAALIAFPGRVFGCVLGNEHLTSVVGVDELIHVDHDGAPGSVARPVLRGLTLHRVTETEPPEWNPTRRSFHNVMPMLRNRIAALPPGFGHRGRPDRRAGRHPDRRGHRNG
ncbi:VWA domain-containing protein [Mycobacteroides abscessus]|uniref:VWA domain-containing protein n=1 Tax=Mycobacteroides abscessus TaxID=36809 RepID=UPI0009A7DB8D|nr:VWA domain-containing protein [Mycobacteroides abscessus]RIT48828.1 VWA domain-containing protein [Mycobacteroides abscessus]SKT87535.1 Uncharacterised protein [Mycobacteroides abscessus subsp. massiliense]SKU07825.1 Uncharacterised protein [Mycobacteroides abscessus subsp. massiliense]